MTTKLIGGVTGSADTRPGTDAPPNLAVVPANVSVGGTEDEYLPPSVTSTLLILPC